MSTGRPSIFRIAEFVNGYPFKPDDLGDEGLPVVRIRQLLDERAEIDYALPPERAVFIGENDLVFSWSATLAIRIWKRGTALLNQHLFRVDPYPGINRRWLAYALEEGIWRLEPLMHGSAMTHITQDMLRSLTIEVPPLLTQRAIADFLDTETARIDGLIEKKQRLTELLEERLSARVSLLLQEAALEPTLLKHLVTKVGSGATPRGGSEVYEQTGVAFLRSQNIRYGQVDHQDLVFINHADDEALARTRVQNGDVLLNITGGSLGRSAVASVSDLPANVSQHVCIIRPRSDVDPLVLQASIESNFVQDQIRLMQVGGNRDGLNFEQVRSLRVQMPSGSFTQLREEIEKAKTLANTFSRKVTQQIDALKEHRRALITAAVTGQLDIPGAAA